LSTKTWFEAWLDQASPNIYVRAKVHGVLVASVSLAELKRLDPLEASRVRTYFLGRYAENPDYRPCMVIDEPESAS
jgi:hypothetical protein